MQGQRFPAGSKPAMVKLIVALLVTTNLAATEKVLHNFGSGMDGANPWASLIWDAAGNLYGTTYGGGTHGSGYGGYGTVFEMTPREDGRWTEKVLHNFGSGMDGAGPFGGLVFDAAGNLYGTTWGGGAHGYGTVFEMTPRADEGWTEKVLYNFGNGMDGANPKASLIWDAAGNLYGTTSNGGVYRAGTVFEMTPRAEGGWTEKVLHNFGSNGDGHSGVDGRYPQVSLIWDAAGNLYGTTQWGGTHDDNGTCYQLGCGTVFELTPRQGAGWTEKVLHNFGSGMDGVHPWASLIWDAAGNLYGTTSEGGTHGPHGPGTVFELSPQSGGGWTEKVVHNFDGDDGGDPFAGLIFDAAGNLYGTTEAGGDYYAGTVFELTPNGSGGWTEKVLHNFGSGMDGADPNASLIWDAAGNLYGTTTQGGTHGGGTVYEITP